MRKLQFIIVAAEWVIPLGVTEYKIDLRIN